MTLLKELRILKLKCMEYFPNDIDAIDKYVDS